MTDKSFILALAKDCELYSKVIEGITVVENDWKPGDLERIEPRDTLIKAAIALRAETTKIPMFDETDVRTCINILLETIADRFDSWETAYIRRDEVAALVRGYKHK